MVQREHPFRSSSQDVLQATLRCNADYQYQKRAVPAAVAPEDESATAPKQGTFLPRVFYGCRTLTQGGKRILTMLATAMRAANVADFYMTKYQSKADQALGPTIQPLIAGWKRQEEADKAPEAADMSLAQRARQRIRRLIFSAHRTLWISACELCVFLTTGDSCVKSEAAIKMFSSRGIAMMHECERMLSLIHI